MYSLNPSQDFRESAVFWLKQYLKYKALTLGNTKANQEKLKMALDKIDNVSTIKEIYRIYTEIRKAGVGINTQFIPVYKYISYIIEKNKYKKMEEINTIDVIEWLQIETSGKKNQTKINYKNAIQNFFTFLSENNSEQKHFKINLTHWQKNLTNAVKSQKFAFLNREEVEKFLDMLESYEQTYKNSKHPDEYLTLLYKIAIKMALFGAMRVSEVLNLKLKDIITNEENEELIIHIRDSKGLKSRIISIKLNKKTNLKEQLKKFLILRKNVITKLKNQNKLKDKEDYLFISYSGKRITDRSLNNMIKRILTLSGIRKEKQGMHLLRHTFATLFDEQFPGHITDLQELLGHSSYETTRKYIHKTDSLEKAKKLWE